VRAEIVAHLPALIKNAVRVESHPHGDEQARPQIPTIHRFYAALDLDGHLDRVKLTVREYGDGTRRHYAVEYVEIARPEAYLAPVGSITQQSPEAKISPTAPTDRTLNLGALLAGVKYEDGTYVFPPKAQQAPAGWGKGVEILKTRGRKVTLWRGYTKAEREQIGEILDACYTIAKTFMLLAHDLAVGRFSKDIATNVQPSIIKEIGRAIAYLRDKGGMAILLVEQYFEFARDLADRFAVMDRGEIVMSGEKSQMDEAHVRRHLAV
jgi:hypothetical protein